MAFKVLGVCGNCGGTVCEVTNRIWIYSPPRPCCVNCGATASRPQQKIIKMDKLSID